MMTPNFPRTERSKFLTSQLIHCAGRSCLSCHKIGILIKSVYGVLIGQGEAAKARLPPNSAKSVEVDPFYLP